jgi:hypothetical protein
MIGQYLSHTNESVTVLILQNILELNKALIELLIMEMYIAQHSGRPPLSMHSNQVSLAIEPTLASSPAINLAFKQFVSSQAAPAALGVRVWAR